MLALIALNVLVFLVELSDGDQFIEKGLPYSSSVRLEQSPIPMRQVTWEALRIWLTLEASELAF